MLTVRLDGEGGAAAKLGRPAKPAADKPKKSLLPMVMPTEDLSKYYNPPVKADPDAEKAREKRPRSEPGLLAEIPVQKRERLTTDGAGAEVADISSDADLNDIDEELTPEIKAQYAGALTKYMARLRHRQNQALQRMRNKEKEIRQAAFQRFLAELETVEIERARQKRLADEVMAQKAAAEAAAMAAAEAAASAAAEAAAAATAVAHAIRSQKGKVGKGSRGYRSGFGDGLRSDDEGSQVPTRPSTPLRPESSVVPERDRIWQAIVSKGIPRVHKMLQQSVITRMSNCRKVAQMCAKEAIRADRAPSSKDFALRCRRANREMILFWKRNEREERELRKKAEKDALERRRQEEEAREARRQARKLNFLITQTELYSHFIGRKIDKGSLDDASGPSVPTDISQIDFDTADEQNLQDHARVNAANALFAQQQSTRAFDEAARFRRAEAAQVSHGARPGTAIATDAAVDHMDFLNPSSLRMDSDVTQPRMITCSLKAYQLKGLNWLANLYEQGINGILADEMGLGKTVQAISLMAHLAEVHNIWGPFLVISPSSTLHNWQQEITKFAPDLKVLPYWGMAKDRKVLRQFWNSKRLYGRDAPFHVLVTSYNLVATDEKYFQRIKWQYMILDEAQAIKSSQSARWKILLGFKCRNRLLLTGTPIQNSMQELWALLHFIMPTLFDSHEEFSEWFSKDIESHAENKSTLNEHQLKRLHMILKPFMLRRVKKDVENELAEKLEVEVICYLSPRQRHIYRGLKEKISVADLLEKVQLEAANSAPGSVSGSLMNLVMQFRKVCNHPELFERADVESPFVMFPPDQIQFSQGSAADGPRWVTYNLVGGLRYRIPKQLYRAGLALVGALSSHPKQSVIDHLFNIWLPLNSVESAEMQVCRLVGLSLSELHKLQSGGLPYLWRYYQCWIQARRLGLLQRHGIASAPASAHQVLALVPACQGFDLTSDAYSLDILSIVKHSVYWRFFTQQYTPKVISAYAEIRCSDRSFAWEHNDLMFNRNHVSTLWRDLSSSMLLGVSDPSEDIARPASDLSHDYIKMPERNRLISDAGKMVVLDSMLPRLRKEGHRVLIFFQMVKMMDLMEEYLIHRKYMYLRLDGSTDMNDRKSRVTDWQTKPEIFVFLLSTRAGGLGINLTAADTVIFYDSDWNPTVDQQAMDRAHRLGQTKQVTVYRLITSATIEERILMRAKQKDEIQKVVISGGEYQQQVDFKPKEVLSLLLGEDELEETLRREELKRKASSAAMASGTSADATPRASLPSKPESKPKGAAKPRTPREPKTRKPAAQRGKSGATAYSDLGSSNGAATTPSGINVGEDQALGVGSNGALESSATSEAPASLPEPVKAARAPKTPKEAKPTRAPRTPKSKAVAGTSPAPPSNGSSGDGAAPLSTPANPSSAMDVDP
ncbi:SNF2 family N-terminal domain-containing protein [Polychytrium aggregatum]|uniref:SNF2 family N-terminal domain-containing protein n=1 Tax=Polychytrium aggregatum TaxID=110093 RepID=UPI0022FF1200|nr:SNF2 family N-terminal domain-containing protein [Polychytrium aggregatum]KAI9202102.1 SNF2 family N-terminal domain-containing protein [Polychytrium aggregatum]